MTDKPEPDATPEFEDEPTGAPERRLHEETDEIDLGDESASDEFVRDESASDESEAYESASDEFEDELVEETDDAPELFDDLPPYMAAPHEAVDVRRRRWPTLTLASLIVVAGAAYVGGYFLTGSRLPANASIAGVDVGGMSPDEAKSAVDKALSPRVDKPIRLTYQGQKFKVKPEDAGLTFDLDRSIEQVGGQRSWNPADQWALFFGQHDHAPALDVDSAALESAIAAIADEIDDPVIEPSITFVKNEPVAQEPKVGHVLPRDLAAKKLTDAYLVTEKTVKIPMEAVEPAVSSEGLARAMSEIAEPAVAEPVTLKVGNKKISLPVSAFAPALTIQAVNGEMAPVIDEKELAGPLTNATTGVGKKAVDATVEIRNGKPVVVPGRSGVGLQPEEMATKLVPVLTKTGAERSIDIQAKVVEPAFTTKDAKALKIKEKIGEFSTFYPHAEYRNINQGRAAELIDGTIIKPGETFSFNDTVGERTVANGFTTGSVINGGQFREELGGGVSQVVTTTYNAAFFGAMKDVEHHPHAFYIDRYPVGREATVYYGSLDLRFKNPTDYGVLIHAYVKRSTPGTRGEMHVELWSTKVWDIKARQSERRNFRSPGTRYDPTDRCVPQSPLNGFDVDIFRDFYRDGKRIKTEKDTAFYQAADRVICGEKPKEKKKEKD